MRKVFFSGRFIKDLRRFGPGGRHRAAILKTVSLLAKTNGPLPFSLREHALACGFAGCFVCRALPDLRLIYKRTPETLTMIAAGSHDQLFRS